MRKVLNLKQKCGKCNEFWAKYIIFDVNPKLLTTDKVTYGFACELCKKELVK